MAKRAALAAGEYVIEFDLVSEDVVSRQLREAALAEEDPILRERLWEEYRSYNDLNN